MKLFALVCVFGIALMLSGCATTPTGDELGAPKEESPGDLYVRIAAEYYRLGEIEVALQNAQKALVEDPENAQAHNVLATIYHRLEQNELAEEHFRQALAFAPKDAYIRTAWGNYLCDQHRFAEAKTQYEQALKNPLYQATWITLTYAGRCAHQAGNAAEAVRWLRRALTVNPRYPPALLEMADVEYAQGRYRAARSYLNRFFQVAGPAPKALLLGSRIERKLGARRKARQYEKQLRKRFPNAPETLEL